MIGLNGRTKNDTKPSFFVTTKDRVHNGSVYTWRSVRKILKKTMEFFLLRHCQKPFEHQIIMADNVYVSEFKNNRNR